MRELTIYQRYFYNSDCYTKGTDQTNKGVQVHSTGANNPYIKRYVQPDDGRIGKNQYDNDHNRPGGNVCAGAYIGKQSDGTVAVYLTLPVGKRVWLSGSGSNGNANRLGYFGFEICQDGLKDINYFNEAVKTASVNFTAWLCSLFKADPDAVLYTFADKNSAKAVMDHSELHSCKLASDHADITSWLRKFGYNMNDYRRWVQEAIDEGVHVTFINCDEEVKTMFYAEVTCTGKYLNMRADKKSNATVIMTLPKGEIVEVLNDSDPTWWQIRYNGTVGYAMHVSSEGVQWLTKITKETETYNPDLVDILLDAKIKLTASMQAQADAIVAINNYLTAIGGE